MFFFSKLLASCLKDKSQPFALQTVTSPQESSFSGSALSVGFCELHLIFNLYTWNEMDRYVYSFVWGGRLGPSSIIGALQTDICALRVLGPVWRIRSLRTSWWLWCKAAKQCPARLAREVLRSHLPLNLRGVDLSHSGEWMRMEAPTNWVGVTNWPLCSIGHSRSRRMMGLFLTLPGTKGARFQVPRFVGYPMVSWIFQVWIAEDPLAY